MDSGRFVIAIGRLFCVFLQQYAQALSSCVVVDAFASSSLSLTLVQQAAFNTISCLCQHQEVLSDLNRNDGIDATEYVRLLNRLIPTYADDFSIFLEASLNELLLQPFETCRIAMNIADQNRNNEINAREYVLLLNQLISVYDDTILPLESYESLPSALQQAFTEMVVMDDDSDNSSTTGDMSGHINIEAIKPGQEPTTEQIVKIMKRILMKNMTTK